MIATRKQPLTILLAAAAVLAIPALALPSGALAGAHPSSAHSRPRKPPPPPPPSGTGYDISYPQCGAPYPSGRSFGIVGVNGGLANNANACLGSQLGWAGSSPGLTSPSQPPASLYLNTADPGNGVADWPRSGSGGPYGSCNGSWSTACSYLYGEQRGSYSYGIAKNASAAVNPANAPWWLDIETANSWATSSSSPNWASLNIATIQGFIAGLRSAGASGPTGFYSTAYQWRSITGLTAVTSQPYFPASDPDWVAGAGSLSQAQANCAATFTGAPVRLTQFPSGGFDGDYACG